MVHALQEIRRVLVAGGSLLDLRPLHSSPDIEVITSDEVLVAGQVDESQGVPTDTAASQALVEAVAAGWFIRERAESFDFATYWDTPDALKDYAAERWRNSRLPEEALAEARRLMALSGGRARVRIRYKMIMGRYGRLGR